MIISDKHDNKQTLSHRLLKRRSNCDGNTLGGGGDFPGIGDNLQHSVPSTKSSLISDDYKFNEKPTFSEDPAKWNKADYHYNINFLYDYMLKQKQYIQHQDYKYAMNKELLENIKRIRQNDYDEAMRKKSEIDAMKTEIQIYKEAIDKKVKEGGYIALRLEAEEKRNKQLKWLHKKVKFEKEFQLKRQAEEGITSEVIEAHELAKRLFDQEQERRKRLLKKSQWYDTELETIKEALAKNRNNATKSTTTLQAIDKEDTDESSDNNNNNNVFPTIKRNVTTKLPEINPGKNSMVTISSQNNMGMDPDNLANTGYLPHPPSMKKDGTNRRFKRKIRGAVK